MTVPPFRHVLCGASPRSISATARMKDGLRPNPPYVGAKANPVFNTSLEAIERSLRQAGIESLSALELQHHGRILRVECLQGARLQEEKIFRQAVLIYRSALNGSVPVAEENPLWILVSISDHWICPVPGEIPDREPWQPAALAVGILHPPELP